jgi:hypothetical protein
MPSTYSTRNTLLFLLILITTTGCAKKYAETSYAPSGAEKYSLQNTPVATDRMLIWNGSPTLDVGKVDRKSTRLNSSHNSESRMPSSA